MVWGAMDLPSRLIDSGECLLFFWLRLATQSQKLDLPSGGLSRGSCWLGMSTLLQICPGHQCSDGSASAFFQCKLGVAWLQLAVTGKQGQDVMLCGGEHVVL